MRQWTPGAVTVFSPTTKFPTPPPNSILIVDEAHHSLSPSWQKVIDAGWGAVLGLTATPWSLRKSDDFRKVWDFMVAGPDYNHLRSQGHLADFRIVYPSRGTVVRREVLVKDSSGEYSPDTVKAETLRVLATDSSVTEWQTATVGLADKRTVLFAPTVAAATQAAEQFAEHGISSAVLHAKTPDAERKAIVKRFRDGSLTVLTNVAVATEGFDCPAAAVVVLLRPTASLSLHRQMIGRVLRPAANKKQALILDLAGNCLQHGGPDRKIQWSLEPRCVTETTRQKTNQYLPCPHGCNSVNHMSSNHCGECEGQLRFECSACRRKLQRSSFPQIDDQQHDPMSLPSDAECSECEDRRKTDRERFVEQARKHFGSKRWKQHARKNGTAEVRLQTTRKLPGCEWSSGTRVVYDGSILVAYAIQKQTHVNRNTGRPRTKSSYQPITDSRDAHTWRDIAFQCMGWFNMDNRRTAA